MPRAERRTKKRNDQKAGSLCVRYRGEGGSVLEIRDGLQETRNLVPRQNGWKWIRPARQWDLRGCIGHPQRRAVEEPQCAHDLIDGLRFKAARDEMQLVLANVIERELVRRALEMEREVLDGADVAGLGARRHVADRHVIDHALPQGRNLFDHGVLLLVGLHGRAIVPARARRRRARPRFPQGLTSRKAGCATYRKWLS